MKKHLQTVQVFTKSGGEYCEVDGILLSYALKDGYATIVSMEEGSKDVWTHIFPANYLKMVRIHETK